MSQIIDISQIEFILYKSRIVASIDSINVEHTTKGRNAIRIILTLVNGLRFQIRLHRIPESTDIGYSYQVFIDRPLFRWDNARHHTHLTNFPHHFHNEFDNIASSNLSGNVIADLPEVLLEIQRILSI